MDDELTKKLRKERDGGLSFQDIARINKMTVPQVLEVFNEGSTAKVTTGGDAIDASEAGPGAQMNYGQIIDIPFSLN